MKPLCVILSVAVLLTGCYSHSVITAESPKSECEVCFRLNDGTHVLSHEYQRVENGYKVVGTLVNKDNNGSRDYSGILLDAQINEVVTNKFDKVKTVGGVLMGISLFVAIFAAGFHMDM